MRILYGIQATGNGHISRSREVVRRLRENGHSVRVLLSGRPESELWGVDDLAPFEVAPGLTFVTRRGRVRPVATALELRLARLFRDVARFDARGIDVVVSDFEPVSARVARRHGIPSIGIGHQYAFVHRVPLGGRDPVARWVLRHFAPVDHPVGLHWWHFDQPILPPIVPKADPPSSKGSTREVVVYLPFEDLDAVVDLLSRFPSIIFHVFCAVKTLEVDGKIVLRPFSRTDFPRRLGEAFGVIANAGFELPSEALHTGKKLLVRAVAGQIEQASNALTLERLGLGRAMTTLDEKAVARWLADPAPPAAQWPDVAACVADWLGRGDWGDVRALVSESWNAVDPVYRKHVDGRLAGPSESGNRRLRELGSLAR